MPCSTKRSSSTAGERWPTCTGRPTSSRTANTSRGSPSWHLRPRADRLRAHAGGATPHVDGTGAPSVRSADLLREQLPGARSRARPPGRGVPRGAHEQRVLRPHGRIRPAPADVAPPCDRRRQASSTRPSQASARSSTRRAASTMRPSCSSQGRSGIPSGRRRSERGRYERETGCPSSLGDRRRSRPGAPASPSRTSRRRATPEGVRRSSSCPPTTRRQRSVTSSPASSIIRAWTRSSSTTPHPTAPHGSSVN